jgi:predicted lipoprotein with Yx(FWY)xxD motif
LSHIKKQYLLAQRTLLVLYQRRIVPAAATLAVTVLAACGGGGSTASPTPATVPAPVVTGSATPSAPKTPAPTAAPTPTPAAAPLATAQLGGAPGFVNAQSHTVYVFDGDLSAPGTSTCNGACAAVWPSVAATAATTYPAPFGEITRSDGSFQLTYAGRPLYTFVVDTAPGSIAGNGITSFGNTWHIARPSGAVAATPTPIPGGPSY